MSLRRLRSSLERLIPRDDADPTRLANLDALFLTSRQCSDKYHRLVPEILNTGNSDSPADFEQSMMWLAFKNDKPADESIFEDNEEEKDEKWKKDWLDRMERREVQIQIILHLFRLCHPVSYPSTQTAEGISPSPKKRKQRDPRPALSLEDKLESLMDKLAMWQLLGSIDDHGINASKSDKRKDDRDWMQVFCEDVVQEAFCKSQPDLCKLLHSKVFRHPIFSDDTDAESPPPDNQKRKAKRQKTLPAAGSTRSREPSLTRTASTSTSISRSRSAHPHLDPNSASTLARSRSLSVSLEAEAKAVSNGKKRMLTREVSMSKGFKRSKSSLLPDPPPEPPAPVVRERPKPTTEHRGLERVQSQVLVEDTPVKPIKQFTGARPHPPSSTTVMGVNENDSRASGRKSSSSLELGEDSFATDTPVKSGRVPRTNLQLRTDLEGDEDEDDEWMIGSPSVRRSLASALTDEDARSDSP
ncbi:hypothetical protein BJ322DRAFT_598281 [Thelephora terrestris]|uniref:DNA replication regulator Sld3 C-terminal domain-containing protein n=1 Tax=Thelephora terrestris TaxID=56493 RepID=A0A9P6HIE3_9AGAM|nr:hypothetical protein BJ322DRAFT_598281 [Thelephora terrestris]